MHKTISIDIEKQQQILVISMRQTSMQGYYVSVCTAFLSPWERGESTSSILVGR